MNTTIRNENESDFEAISEVTKEAFRSLAISNHTEQFIINALRNANALTISLVAEKEKKVVGRIAFSPVTISDGSLDWYGLGPSLSCRSYKSRAMVGPALDTEHVPRLRSQVLYFSVISL